MKNNNRKIIIIRNNMTQMDLPKRNNSEEESRCILPPQSYSMDMPRITKNKCPTDGDFEDQKSPQNFLFDTSPPPLAPDISTPFLLRSAKSLRSQPTTNTSNKSSLVSFDITNTF